MWVEVTFEIFAAVIVAYLYRKMGFVLKAEAERATYIAVMLFFLTAVIDVGHIFHWIVKPTGVIACAAPAGKHPLGHVVCLRMALFCGCSVTVFLLFFTINMTVKTSFIVFDFWRWLVVHLWVEVTFEFFPLCSSPSSTGISAPASWARCSTSQ